MFELFRDPTFSKFLLGLGSGMMGARTFGQGLAQGVQQGAGILAEDLTRKQRRQEEEAARQQRISERQQALGGLFSGTDYEKMPDEAKSMMEQGMGLLNTGDETLMPYGVRLMTDANNYTQALNKQKKLNNAVPEVIQVDAPGIGKISQLVYKDKDTGDILEKAGAPVLPAEYYGYRAGAQSAAEIAPKTELTRQQEGIKTTEEAKREATKTGFNIFQSEQQEKFKTSQAGPRRLAEEQAQAGVKRTETARESVPAIQDALKDINSNLSLLDKGLTTGKFNDLVRISDVRKVFGDTDYENFEATSKRLALANLKSRLGTSQLSNADVLYNVAAEGIGPNMAVKTNRDRLLKMKAYLESELGRKQSYMNEQPTPENTPVGTTDTGESVYQDANGYYVTRNGKRIYKR